MLCKLMCNVQYIVMAEFWPSQVCNATKPCNKAKIPKLSSQFQDLFPGTKVQMNHLKFCHNFRILKFDGFSKMG